MTPKRPKPVYLDEAGGIGMFCVAYQAECIPATATEPGIFRWDDLDLIAKRIAEIKSRCRWCVIVSHGGEEFTSLPSPYTRDRYLKFLELGADVVVAHHPHVPENYELFDNGKAIFYSLGNFVSTQESFDALLEGMGCFTIQKTVKDGQTSIEIIDPQIKPMVMHYNKDAGVFSPYMLSDYTEELASQHEVRTVLGDDSFTLANLQAALKKSCP